MKFSIILNYFSKETFMDRPDLFTLACVHSECQHEGEKGWIYSAHSQLFTETASREANPMARPFALHTLARFIISRHVVCPGRLSLLTMKIARSFCSHWPRRLNAGASSLTARA